MFNTLTTALGVFRKIKESHQWNYAATKICIRHKSMRLSRINVHYDGSPNVLAGLNVINL